MLKVEKENFIMKKQLIALGAFLVMGLSALPSMAACPCQSYSSSYYPSQTLNRCCPAAPCATPCCPAAPIMPCCPAVKPCCPSPCATPCCPAPCGAAPCCPDPCPCPAAPCTHNDLCD